MLHAGKLRYKTQRNMAPLKILNRFPIENWICSIAMSILPGSVPWYLKLLFSQNVGILVDVFFPSNLTNPRMGILYIPGTPNNHL